jgi:putative ABC transport system permease protein
MIGLALACTMAIVGDSAKASVDRSVEENFVGDYIVSNVFGQPFSPSIAREMARVEGVDQVIRERFALATWEGEDEGLAAVDPGTLDEMEVRVADGSLEALDDDSVVVSQEWADEKGLEVGDTMTWELPSGETDLEVVGTFEENPIIFFPVLTTISALEEAGFAKGDNALIIMSGGEQVGLQNRLDEVVADIPVVTVKNESEFAEEQRGPIDQLVLMIFALLGLALVIAVLGIVNTLALSIIERTREVGLLRAIGVSRAQLRWMITLESVVISLLGALLGVVLGIGFGVALMYAIRDQGLEVISVPWEQLVVFLVLSLVIGVLAAVFPARRAARLDVLRAIATE